MALGPYVPFEVWPPSTRAGIAAAYVAKADATAARIRSFAQRPSCSCADGGHMLEGRCERCYGYEVARSIERKAER
jgi:hypothetical protein